MKAFTATINNQPKLPVMLLCTVLKTLAMGLPTIKVTAINSTINTEAGQKTGS